LSQAAGQDKTIHRQGAKDAKESKNNKDDSGLKLKTKEKDAALWFPSRSLFMAALSQEQATPSRFQAAVFSLICINAALYH